MILFDVRRLKLHLFFLTMEGLLALVQCISIHASYTACKPVGTCTVGDLDNDAHFCLLICIIGLRFSTCKQSANGTLQKII